MAETLFRQWFVEEAKDDWEKKSLGQFVSHLKESVTPNQLPARLFHHYSLPAFDEGRSPVVELGAQILSNKYRVPSGTLLVSKLNPRFPRIWPVEKASTDSICSTEFQVLKPNDQELFGFIYFLLTSSNARDELTMPLRKVPCTCQMVL